MPDTQQIEAVVQNTSAHFKRIEKELNGSFLERKAEIRSLLITLVANENIAFVGRFGTGKSGLVNCFTQLISGKMFKRQVDGFTQPEDVLGHHSFKKLREDDVRQLKVANYAPEADIVYLGEGFKMNNTMMNSMLLLLNERQVDIGEGIRMDTNNKMIITDSNEYPTDGELEAFWDRWTVRMEVTEITSDRSFMTFWDGYGTGKIGKVDDSLAIPMKSITDTRDRLWLVNSDDIAGIVKHIRTELLKEDMLISTRRWGKIKKMLHASALFNGRLRCDRKDLEILSHCLWRTVDEREVINGIISKCIGGDIHQSHKLLSQARRNMTELTSANIPDGAGGVQYLGPVLASIRKLLEESQKLDNSDDDVAEVTTEITNYARQIGQMVNDRLRV